MCGTDILCGMRAVVDLAQQNPVDRIIFVFISDGQDHHQSTIEERISTLPRLPAKEVFMVTVAVGSGFPTGLALSMREKFSTAHVYGLPFVLQIPKLCAEDCDYALSALQGVIAQVLRPEKVNCPYPLIY